MVSQIPLAPWCQCPNTPTTTVSLTVENVSRLKVKCVITKITVACLRIRNQVTWEMPFAARMTQRMTCAVTQNTYVVCHRMIRISKVNIRTFSPKETEIIKCSLSAQWSVREPAVLATLTIKKSFLEPLNRSKSYTQRK